MQPSSSRVNFFLEQVMEAQGRAEVQLRFFFNPGARWGEWSRPRSGRFVTGKVNRQALYRRLIGSQSRSGRLLKPSPPSGFDPPCVQPAAILCTANTIPAHQPPSGKMLLSQDSPSDSTAWPWGLRHYFISNIQKFLADDTRRITPQDFKFQACSYWPDYREYQRNTCRLTYKTSKNAAISAVSP